MTSLWLDVRYAFRAMRHQPFLAAGVICVLTLAIGLNTSLFTIFNAVALRPWAVPEPDRVVTVHSSKGAGLPLAEYAYFSKHSRTLANLFAARPVALRMADARTPLRGQAVSLNFFAALQVPMAAGRGFSLLEPGVEAVISYGLWQSRFAAEPSIVGRDVRLNGVPVTVVGVTAREFAGTTPDGADLWIPITAVTAIAPNDVLMRSMLEDPNTCCWSVAGRLKPGETRRTAQVELALFSSQYRSEIKADPTRIAVATTDLLSSPEGYREMAPVFTLLFAAVAIILLLACANAGNLLLARAAARQREIAVRLSAGATRPRLIRQLLTESLAMALIAGGLGVVLAFWLPERLMQAVAVGTAPEMRPDSGVLIFTLVASVIACLACGLTPALHATRLTVADALKNAGTGRTRARAVLLGVQVAASVVLLVSAVLLARGIAEIRTHDPGFRYDDVASIALDLPRYDAARVRALSAQLELTTGAGLAMAPPFGGRYARSLRLPEGIVKIADFNEVNGRYFEVLSIPFLEGRNFGPESSAQRVAIVNESLARALWPGQSAVGKRFTSDEAFEVIGVVRDAYTDNLDSVQPTFYVPVSGRIVPSLLVRRAELQSTEAAVAKLEPRAIAHSTPVSAQVERWMRPWKLSVALASGIGAFALVLAAVGIFGVFSYAVRQQTREIAVRMAVGAQTNQVIRAVLMDAGRPVAAGLAAGLPGAFAASWALQSALYGTAAASAAAYVMAVLIVVLSAGIAAIVPARLIARVDPMAALRSE